MKIDARSRLTSFMSLAALCAAASMLMACNGVTGAGDLRFVKDTDDDDTSDPNTTGGGEGGAGGGSTTGGQPSACIYPAMNQGNEIGQVVRETFKWPGYAENSATIGEIVPSDYYDCDGSKGINAILVLKSALWCGACQQEASQLNSTMDSKWKAMGIHVLTLMLDDAEPGTPATEKTAETWKNNFKLESTAVAVDPNVMTMVPSGTSSIGLPYGVVIDPRTMTILYSEDGAAGLFDELEALASKNSVK